VKDQLLRPDQVAEKLNVSTKTIYRLLGEAQLVGLKVRGSIRIPEASVTDYIKRQVALFQLVNGTGDDSQ